MMIKTAACLLALSLLGACTTTTTTTKRETLREMQARYATNSPYSSTEPAPPAEGPEAVGAGPMDPNENPALVPSPLLRMSAAGGL